MDYVLRQVLVHAYLDFFSWDHISKLLAELKELGLFCDIKDTQQQGLHLETFDKVYYTLRQQSNANARTHLEEIVTGCPTFRPFLTRSEGRVEVTPLMPEIGTNVLRTLLALCKDLKAQHGILDVLETRRSRSPSMNDWITPFLDRHLTTLSLGIELMHHLQVYACHLGRMQGLLLLDHIKDDPKLTADLLKSKDGWQELFETGFWGIVDVNLGDPSDGKFEYPSDEGRDMESVKKRRKAEKHLDVFWKSVDTAVRKKTGLAYRMALRKLLNEGGHMRRTADWTDPEASNTSDAKISTKDVYEHQSFSTVLGAPARKILRNFSPPELRLKAKTRGQADPTMAVEAQDAPASDEEPQRHLFRVDPDAYTVFKALFHMPHESSYPSQLEWDDFKKAMAALGFAIHRLQGSAWEFTPPPSFDTSTDIQFHEPHPEKLMPLLHARRFGRRLLHAYGLDGTMFAVE